MPRLTTRDYKRTSRASSAAKLKEFGFGVIVGAALASAGFLIGGAHARHRAAASSSAHAGADARDGAPHAPAPDDTSSNSSGAADGPASTSRSTASAPAGTPAQHYDFYRMLPSFKVPVPHDDGHGGRPPPPATTQPTPAAGSAPEYVLQVGSYRSSAEADQVRARLARAGITAQVQHIVSGSKTWNRVRIGPLSDADLAKVRAQLRTANLHALVIRADR